MILDYGTFAAPGRAARRNNNHKCTNFSSRLPAAFFLVPPSRVSVLEQTGRHFLQTIPQYARIQAVLPEHERSRGAALSSLAITDVVKVAIERASRAMEH
jgi:hypothetical protein